MEALAERGVAIPPNPMGLTGDPIEELHLVDELAERCTPSGSDGPRYNKDQLGKRSG